MDHNNIRKINNIFSTIKWYVRLVGNEYDVITLHSIIKGSKKYRIIKIQDSYYLYNKEYNKISNPSEVFDIVKEQLKNLNAITKTNKNDYKFLDVDAIKYRDESGTIKQNVFVGVTITANSMIRVTGRIVSGTSSKQKPKNQLKIDKLLKVVNNDNNIKKFINIINTKSLNWVELYNIFEIVEENIGTGNIENFITKSRLKLFKHTANFEARHGKSIIPPKNPMKIREAEEMILFLAREWLKLKI